MRVCFNGVALHGVTVLLPRAMHYITKAPVPGMENFLCRCWSEEYQSPKTIWAVSFGLGSLPELEGKALLLLKTHSPVTGLGGVELKLTWKAPP